MSVVRTTPCETSPEIGDVDSLATRQPGHHASPPDRLAEVVGLSRRFTGREVPRNLTIDRAEPVEDGTLECALGKRRTQR